MMQSDVGVHGMGSVQRVAGDSTSNISHHGVFDRIHQFRVAPANHGDVDMTGVQRLCMPSCRPFCVYA